MAIPFYLPIGNKWVFLSYSIAYPVWLTLWILHSGLCLWHMNMSSMPTSGILSHQQQHHSGVCEFLLSLSFVFLILSQVLTVRNEPIMLNTSRNWWLLLLLLFKGPKGLKESFVLYSGNSLLVPSANNKACVPRTTHHQALFVAVARENPSLVRH